MGVVLSDAEFAQAHEVFDCDADGVLDYAELLQGVTEAAREAQVRGTPTAL